MDRKIIRKRIKLMAQGLLAGSWLRSFLIVLLQTLLYAAIISFLPIRIPTLSEIANFEGTQYEMLMMFVPKVITERTIALCVITLILYVLVMAPFSVGICRFFLRVASGAKGKISDVFSVYTNLRTVFSSVWLLIIIFLLSAIWMIVFMLIPITVAVCGSMIKSPLLVSFAGLLAPISAVFGLVWVSRYEFARFILAEGRAKGAFSAISECFSLLKNRTGECLALRTSYILWDVASFYIYPLGFVYFSLFNTVYAQYLYYFRQSEMNMGENSQNTAS